MNLTDDQDAIALFNESREARTAFIRETALSSLRFFVDAFWPVLEPGKEMQSGWALDAMVEHLEAVERGDIRRLLISVPPGSMKSMLTRAFYPAWFWARKPDTRFIGVAYAEKLAVRDNMKCRRIVTSELYQRLFPEIKLAPDEAGKTTFANTKTGRMVATSVGGTLTGERGDCVICDDLLSAPQANSDAERAKANLWFRETLPSRVNDIEKSSFIIIGQRLHSDDCYQIAIEQGYDQLLIPAEYEPARAKTTSIGWTDPRTEPDELYWPTRYPKTELDLLRATLGPYGYSAQFQQDPTPREGGLIPVENIRVIPDIPDEPYQVYDGWDLAGTEKKYADYSARAVLIHLTKSNRFVIVYADRNRWNPGKVEAWIHRTAEEIANGGGYGDMRSTTIVLPEDPAQAGKAQRRYLAAGLTGFSVWFDRASTDKVSRAQGFASAVENGKVDMLEGPWNDPYLNELRQFPLGAHDDWVDATSSAFTRAAMMMRMARPAPKIDRAVHTNQFRID